MLPILLTEIRRISHYQLVITLVVPVVVHYATGMLSIINFVQCFTYFSATCPKLASSLSSELLLISLAV